MHWLLHGVGSHSTEIASERAVPGGGCQDAQRGPARLLRTLSSPQWGLCCCVVLRGCHREIPGAREGLGEVTSRRACDMEAMVVAIFGKCKRAHFVLENPLERISLGMSSCFTITGQCRLLSQEFQKSRPRF